jgi:hypothetical protein
MVVVSGDRKNPQQAVKEWPQLADAYAVSRGNLNISRCNAANMLHATKGLKVNGHECIIYKHPCGHNHYCGINTSALLAPFYKLCNDNV